MSITVGVIGCGYWGPNLVRNFAALDGTEVVAVADQRTERLDFIRKNYPAIGTFAQNPDELLNDPSIDAIVISTPVSTHFQFGKKALEQGKHLFVEKPFTATVEEATELIDLAEQKNLRIMVDHTFIYTGAVRKIKEIIDRGMLGQLYYFDSVRVNLGLFQHDVNVIWDLAPHDVSIMDHLLSRPPRAIAATGVAHFNADIENIAYLSTYYDDNLLGHIHVNWLAPVKVRKTLISGATKMVVYDDMEPSEKVKIYDRGVDVIEDREQIYDMLIQYRTGDMLAPKIDLTEALKLVAAEFRDSINENRTPLTDGQAGRRVVEILVAANKSMRRSGEVIALD